MYVLQQVSFATHLNLYVSEVNLPVWVFFEFVGKQTCCEPARIVI